MKLLDGKVENFNKLLNVLREVSLVPIKDSLREVQKLKTCIHEITHSILHNSEYNDNIAEIESESVAYIVCSKLGIDTSEYSFGYVATWAQGKKPEELESIMKNVSKTAKELFNQIEEKMNTQEKSIKPFIIT